MAESSAIPALPGLVLEAVEWLPSGADSGLVRVRGRWVDEGAREPDLPFLMLRAGGADQHFESLPDARFSRDPDSWRGTYLVAAELVATDPEALWVEWPSGARAGLPPLTRGAEPTHVPAAPERPEEPDEPGGQVIDHAVLAERRARRAEAAEQASARAAAEALKAVEVLELRSAELERRLEAATAERDALAARADEGAATEAAPPGSGEAAEGRHEALTAALAAAAEVRARAREWQLLLRTSEILRAGDSVRLAVLESQRGSASASAGAREAALADELAAARSAAEELRTRTGDLETELAEARSAADDLETELATAQARVHEESVARATLEDELDRARAAQAENGSISTLREDLDAARAESADLRGQLEHAQIATADLHGRLQQGQADRAALRAQLQAAGAEADRLRAEGEQARAEADRLRAAGEEPRAEAERLREVGEEARAEAERLREVREEARAEAERLRAERDEARADLAAARAALESEREAFAASRAASAADLERLAREQTEAASAREPADAGRLVADLDTAAAALRRRAVPQPPPGSPEPVAPDAELVAVPWRYADGTQAPEPAAPDAEPASEWDAREEPRRDPVTHEVEPVRARDDEPGGRAWQPPGIEPQAHEDDAEAEPPAPDAEPAVEWAMPAAGPAEPRPAASPATAESEPATATAEPPSDAPPTAAEPSSDQPTTEAERGAGPRIVSAPRPPARGLMVGSSRREYPLLRGALVKLAHDDPALAGRVLAALLPAQGVVVRGPLSYDVSIGGVGTFAVSITAGRAFVRPVSRPRSRAEAEFHLRAAPLVLAELLAGVDHRIGRFFGPARIRGRKRRAKALRALPTCKTALAEAARAGAQLEPELVYRTLAYAVHPSWTRGHRFTIAQAIGGDAPETWYLTAEDGAGLSVSPALRNGAPDASVTMTRDVFDHLVRGEPVSAGERPIVRGDREAVEHMTAWTRRVQG
ncbi:MAG TPA: hypothetical protein VHJ39_20450 [Solirubrobacteraceae bacterium]|nr:hypothetical protein [Solirubrobacteraceae bacterium]